MQSSSVSELSALIKWRGESGSSFNWSAIEQRLGSRIPADYKELMTVFPRGMFFGLIQVAVPHIWKGDVDLLGEFRIVLDNMRETRAAGYKRFPYPIYPEVGGLIIWGNGRNGEEFYWLPNSDDPDEWGVVAASSGWDDWAEVPGPMSRFLLDVGTGQSAISFLPRVDPRRLEFAHWPDIK